MINMLSTALLRGPISPSIFIEAGFLILDPPVFEFFEGRDFRLLGLKRTLDLENVVLKETIRVKREKRPYGKFSFSTICHLVPGYEVHSFLVRIFFPAWVE